MTGRRNGAAPDRRAALSWMGCGLLGACGGGGGGATPAPAPAPSSETSAAPTPAPAETAQAPAPGGATTGTSTGTAVAPAPAPSPPRPPGGAGVITPDIACWGDSITDLYWRSLQTLYPERRVFNGGVVGQTSAQIAARQQGDAVHRSWISIFWYGHNNWVKDEVLRDVALSVAALAPGNRAFVVLSMLNWAQSGDRGTQEYQDTVRVNAALAAAYPDNYLDIRRHLVGLYNPASAQDVQDNVRDLPPSSLRFDRIHLNDAGCLAVARRVRDFLASKGW